ncbi:MAG: hypothetical protein C4325_06965 [Blastocatellia bacterium]
MSNDAKGSLKVFVANSTDFPVGTILRWSEVSAIHHIRQGIYQRNGLLVSLLTDFGKVNPCYPDYRGNLPGEIFYTGSGRRGDQKLDAANRAMIDAISSGHAVPLFVKLAPGKWRFEGYWKITSANYIYDEKTDRMVWRFRLQCVDAAG